jgi:polyisoprenoid-binding protein YceI
MCNIAAKNLFGLCLLAAAAWLGPGSLAAAETVFDLDPSKTEIQFTLHDVLHTVHGTFHLKRGAIQWDPATGKASGEVVVDVTSGASGSQSRDRRMHKEILESQQYPEAVFTPDHLDGQVAPQGESQVDVHGTFRIHGAGHEMVLHFVVQAGGNQFSASTHFTLPYVNWGMKNPSNFLLKVDDKLEMDIHAVTIART